MTEAASPRHVPKPWGHEIWWAHTARYVGKLLHVRRGESLSLQFHEIKEETIFVQSGRLRFETALGAEPGALVAIELRPGDTYHIPPGTIHRMTGLDDCDVIEVSTPEVDDVVRLEDRYGRARAPGR
jgi:mannose-6-phosphate isomerase-like protein (cupin superfamily)